MPRRAHRKRSATEWGVRIALAAGAGFLGYASVANTLAYSMRGKNVERAHALAPGDARIAASLSEKLLDSNASPAARAEAARLAREALRNDPTVVPAAATLGFVKQLEGDAASARRLLEYSQTLSRRDLRTQLWAIEDAVARGDVPAALKHYDIALRTSRTAPDLLFPILSAAIDDAEIRANLVRTLAGKPIWAPRFIEFVAGNGPNPRATAALFRDLHRARLPVSETARTAVTRALITANLFEDAWGYYAASHPGANRNRSRDSRFLADLEDPSPFDWMSVNDGGISTSIRRGGDGGTFDFAAPSVVGGLMLRQLQMLPPGKYLLEGRSAGIDQPPTSRPYWLLSCIDGRELGRVEVPNSAQSDGKFAGSLTVPAGCAVQHLSLIARPSDAMGGVSGEISRVELRPEG